MADKANLEYHRRLNTLMDNLETQMATFAERAHVLVRTSPLDNGDSVEIHDAIRAHARRFQEALDDIESSICSRLDTLDKH